MIDKQYLQNMPDSSPKRYETLILLAAGYSYRQISELREISYNTVVRTLQDTRARVGARSDTHLVHLAHQAGIL